MTRSKEDIAQLLVNKKLKSFIADSKWSDLVSSIQSFSPQQKNMFMGLLIGNETKKAGEILKKALIENAKLRARANIDQILSDDSLTLSELDELL